MLFAVTMLGTIPLILFVIIISCKRRQAQAKQPKDPIPPNIGVPVKDQGNTVQGVQKVPLPIAKIGPGGPPNFGNQATIQPQFKAEQVKGKAAPGKQPAPKKKKKWQLPCRKRSGPNYNMPTVARNDPAYATLADLKSDAIYDHKAQFSHGQAIHPLDPQYATLGNLDDELILGHVENKPANVPQASPHDPAYHTLNNLHNEEIMPLDKQKHMGESKGKAADLEGLKQKKPAASETVIGSPSKAAAKRSSTDVLRVASEPHRKDVAQKKENEKDKESSSGSEQPEQALLPVQSPLAITQPPTHVGLTPKIKQ